MIEAFRVTADAHPDRVAVRTPDDAVSYTFADVRERAERLAAGLHGLGLRRGDSLGIMLVNRPEFHVVDLAALFVGATPFSIYNTSAPEQIEYLFGDAGARIALTERQFVERVLAARDAGTPLETIILLDAEPDESLPDGVISLAQAEAAADGTFDLEASIAAVEPDDVLTLIYTSGTTGPAEGRDADAREPPRDDPRPGCDVPVPRERHGHLVPPVRSHRRSLGVPLLGAHDLRVHDHHVRGPQAAHADRRSGAADAVRRSAADLGEAEGGARGDGRRAGGSGGQGEDGGGDRRPPCGRSASSRPASRCRTSSPPRSRPPTSSCSRRCAPAGAGQRRAERRRRRADPASRCSSSSPRSACRRASCGG